MKTGGWRFVVQRGCLLLLAAVAAGFTQGAPSPLFLDVRAPGLVTNGRPWQVDLTLSNAGSERVSLGSANALFGWLVVTVGRDKAWFSERIPLTPASPWPDALAAGAALTFRSVDAGAATGYPYGQGLKLDRGYPVSATGEAPVSAGRIGSLLTAGRVHARWLVCLPQPGESPPLQARSAPLEITVEAAGPVAAAPQDPAAVAELLQAFNRDPWSAQQAHDRAVKMGLPVLSNLTAAAAEQARPGFARLWLATAVADIPSPYAVAALTRLLDDPAADVRCVVAYYGPKQKSATLDRAIIAAATRDPAARLTSYALLGFLVFRGEAPDDLLQAGLENRDPRARDATVRALATMASEANTTRLNALLQDRDEHVRAAARRVLDALNPRAMARPAAVP